MNVYDRIIVLFSRSFFGFDSFIYSFLAFFGIVYCKDQDDDGYYVLVPFMLLVVIVLAPAVVVVAMTLLSGRDA